MEFILSTKVFKKTIKRIVNIVKCMVHEFYNIKMVQIVVVCTVYGKS
jgi:hypothetical protein